MRFNEILPNQLYLGPALQNQKEELQKDAPSVTHIANITQHEPSPFPDVFKYLRISILDQDTVRIYERFDDFIKFVDEALSEGGAVYVHCSAGVSRSSSFVIAYLIQRKGMTLKEAFEFVKQRRSAISPNLGFMKQLIELEFEVHGKESISMKEYSLRMTYETFPDLDKKIIDSTYEECKGDMSMLMNLLLDRFIVPK